DGDACTHTDTCQAGACVGGSPVVCTATDQCHDAGTCDPATGICSNPARRDGATCNDGDACTKVDRCAAGLCVGSDPVVCATPDQCHAEGTCNPTTGVCSNPTRPDGTQCNDGDLCTSSDACHGGVCTGTTASCDDGNPCTDDSCSPTTGCV